MGGISAGGTAGTQRSVTFRPSTSELAPHTIAVGPDGNLWSTDLQVTNYLSSFTAGGLPGMFGLDSALPYELTGLVAGPDHALWMANAAGWIHRVDTSTPGSVKNYAITGGKPSYIVLGPDGALWFSDPGHNAIGRITTAGIASSFPIPTPGSGVQGIAAGPDGNLWFTESDANKIGRLNPAGALMELAVPTPGASPQQIVPGPDGALWFTERDANQIGRITTGGVVSELPLPRPGSKPVGIAAGPDAAVWFTETAGGAIGRLTMDGSVTEFSVSREGSSPFSITVGPDGDLWYTLLGDPAHAPGGGGVGRLTPESKPFCLLAGTPFVSVSCQSPTETVIISNAGQTPSGTLSVSLDVTNPMAAVFELGGTCAGTNLNPGDSCTIIASFSKPTNPATGYHALVNIQPQLGDRYDMIVVASGCP